MLTLGRTLLTKPTWFTWTVARAPVGLLSGIACGTPCAVIVGGYAVTPLPVTSNLNGFAMPTTVESCWSVIVPVAWPIAAGSKATPKLVLPPGATVVVKPEVVTGKTAGDDDVGAWRWSAPGPVFWTTIVAAGV